jgi:serine/threonine-protein kinase
MASVWRAADETLRREVAIKFLYAKSTRDPASVIDRFLREARIAASVQHRNVIHTVDFGALDDEQPFMVMELLNGESLAQRFEREPPLDQTQIVHLVSLTLRGLGAVHDAGIVHRDLKPANIFLQRDADAVYPKILDFGISRSLRQGTDRPSAIDTQDGMIVGTPDYMSPEQARGETDVDKRADIYSMGVILYRGLTGKLPFVANTIGDLLVKIISSTAPTVRELCPDVSPSLSAVVEQAMTRNREDRFADARAMRRALRSVTDGTSSSGRRAVSLGTPRSGDMAQAASAPRGRPEPRPERARDGWGDLEGSSTEQPPRLAPVAAAPAIASARAPDPVPVRSAAPVPATPDAPAAAPTAAPGTEKAAAAPGDAPAPTQGLKGLLSMSDMLNPLYRGRDLPALDIDYDRVKSERGKDRLPAAAEQGRPARPAAAKAKAAPAAKKPERDAPAPKRADKAKLGRGAVLWLLALAAFALAVHLMSRPAGDVASPQVEPRGLDTRPIAKSRRANLRNTPPHLRDVQF